MNEIKIVGCTADDAPLIGKAVVMAIREELAVKYFCRKGEPASKVEEYFIRLAAMKTSQYSYLNSVKAIDTDGAVMGIMISYDGADLEKLRVDSAIEAKELFGLILSDDEMPDETVPGELYIDSLAVFPHYRRRGVARKLLEVATEKARRLGKPAGLLVDKRNHHARSLYDGYGFKYVGETLFAGELMDHLQIEHVSEQ